MKSNKTSHHAGWVGVRHLRRGLVTLVGVDTLMGDVFEQVIIARLGLFAIVND